MSNPYCNAVVLRPAVDPHFDSFGLSRREIRVAREPTVRSNNMLIRTAKCTNKGAIGHLLKPAFKSTDPSLPSTWVSFACNRHSGGFLGAPEGTKQGDSKISSRLRSLILPDLRPSRIMFYFSNFAHVRGL